MRKLVLASCLLLISAAAPARASIDLYPGQSVTISGQTVYCNAGNGGNQCRTDADCNFGEVCVFGQCVRQEANLERSYPKCVPTGQYTSLENELKIISELSDGSTRQTSLGKFQYKTDCESGKLEVSSCDGTATCRDQVCIPTGQYTSLNNDLLSVVQTREGDVRISHLGSYQYRSDCEAARER